MTIDMAVAAVPALAASPLLLYMLLGKRAGEPAEQQPHEAAVPEALVAEEVSYGLRTSGAALTAVRTRA